MTAPTTVSWDGVARGYVPPATLSIDPGLPLHENGSAPVDPVTFEVIRYALLNANVEHGQTLQRLCVSPITMLTRDFQPSLPAVLLQRAVPHDPVDPGKPQHRPGDRAGRHVPVQ